MAVERQLTNLTNVQRIICAFTTCGIKQDTYQLTWMMLAVLAVWRQFTNLINVQSSCKRARPVIKSRHLPVDLGEVDGVGFVEAAHKFKQCAE